MNRVYHLEREQLIPTDLETAWNFISTPNNLEALTPEDMSFSIISEIPDVMYEGLLIEYRIRIPILGKQTWLSEIRDIKDRHSFVDVQNVGPYRYWHHYHEVTEQPNGIRFFDHVTYALPFGYLGSMLHTIYVGTELSRIFDYRHEAMRRLLTG